MSKQEVEAPPGPEVALTEAYPAWSAATSRVISGPLGQARFPGERYYDWRTAKAAVSKKHTVFLFWVLGSRWFARIKRSV